MLLIQHDFCHVKNNWKHGPGKSQTSVHSRQLESQKKTSSDWENTFGTVIQLGIQSPELGPLFIY
jgi:hypothetical protein